MAKSNKRKAAIQRDMRRLITLVTGFDEKDENFPVCLQYVDSNFKYHRYLSPDSHQIHRAIDGLCEKFQVCSQGQKASDFKELTEQFLNQPGLDGKETGKTDVHYGMLSLLIDLAISPTHVDYVRKKPEVVQEEIDNFDWKSYLLEGEDLNFISHASSDSEEEEPLDGNTPDPEREEKSVHFEEGKVKQASGEDESEMSIAVEGSQAVSDPSSFSKISLPFDVSAVSEEGDALAQLEQCLVVEYWKGKGNEELAGGSHKTCNIARDWKCYWQRMNPLHQIQSQVVVTEIQVVRETLWMLWGVTDLFIFQHDGRSYQLNPDVYVLHLTPESLENSLVPLMHAARQIHALDTLDDVISGSGSLSGHTSKNSDEELSRKGPPLTYIAFSSCVREFLKDFRKELVAMEKTVIKKESAVLLASLTSKLRPWLLKLEAVHRVILHGLTTTVEDFDGGSISNAENTTASVSESQTQHSDTAANRSGDHLLPAEGSNCYRATLLLDALYKSLLEADLASLGDNGDVASLLLNMLVRTSEPLLQIISNWINNGVLTDFGGDFVLCRNKGIKSLGESFWDEAFVPSMVNPPVDPPSRLESQSKSLQSKGSSFQQWPSSSDSSSYQAAKQESSNPSNFVITFGPKFLQPIFRETIMAGKSMAMLESLGRIKEALNIDADVFKSIPSLYELFLADLKKALILKNPTKDDSQTETEFATLTNEDVPADNANTFMVRPNNDATIEKQLNMSGVKDTLLKINFAGLFRDPMSAQVDAKRSEIQCPTTFDIGLYPVMSLLENCLYPHVHERYSAVCSKLVHILKQDYDLMGCIHAMQRYYLMSSGEVMHDFYTPIFNKIENRDHWRDHYLLEMLLQDAVEPAFPSDVPRLSVEISNASLSKQKSAINATDCICLKYKVPWPVQVVISSKCKSLYNDVFNFILQIKRAKFTLDQLRFDDLSREQVVSATVAEEFFPGAERVVPRKCRIHQFHVLRFRLQYFVNSLHNYIMTRILHSTELEFGHRFDEAEDLDQIINIHGQYVAAVHERCLMHPKLSVLRETVSRVLNLCLTFSSQWRRGVDFTSPESVQEVNTELSRSLHFLSSFLKTIVKRGPHPQLESLAFALVSSLKSNPS